MLKMPLKQYSQRGGGIILSMIIMAIIASVSIYVINLFTEVQKNVAKDNRKASYRHLVGAVKSALFTGENCTSMLNLPVNFAQGNPLMTNPANPDLYFPPNPTNWGQSVVLNYNYGQMLGPIRYNANPNLRFTIPGGTSIYDVKIKLERSSIIPPPPVVPALLPPIRLSVQRDILGAPKLEARWAIITLIPEHPGIFLWRADKDKNLQIRTMIYMLGNTLYGCFDPVGEAAVCTIAGGAYNPAPGVANDRRCEPDLNCFTHKIGIVSSASSCPSPYLARGIGSGKYTCQWCNRNPKP